MLPRRPSPPLCLSAGPGMWGCLLSKPASEDILSGDVLWPPEGFKLGGLCHLGLYLSSCL